MPVNCHQCFGGKKAMGMGGIKIACPTCKGLGRIADPKIMNATEIEKVYCDKCKLEIIKLNAALTNVDSICDSPINESNLVVALSENKKLEKEIATEKKLNKKKLVIEEMKFEIDGRN